MKTTFVVVSSITLMTSWKSLLEHLPTLWILLLTQEWIWWDTIPFDEALSATLPSVDEVSIKKEKKKKTVHFLCGGLPSDVRHFDDNSTINVLMEDPIPYMYPNRSISTIWETTSQMWIPWFDGWKQNLCPLFILVLVIRKGS